MTFIEQTLQRPVVIRMGWTLIHFLWQGAVVAAVLGCALRAMRKQSAQARYFVACAGMLALATCPMLTFAVLPERTIGASISSQAFSIDPASTGAATHGPAGGGAAGAEIGTTPAVQTHADVPVLVRVRHATNRLMPWLVAAWASGVIFLSLRLLSGLLGIERARRGAIAMPALAMQRRMLELARRMGIGRPVRLLESASIAGPAVVGIFKPVILFPAAALTGLWPIQIEAILAHELAHIRRHDYLVNLFQSVIETVLFYHPAVWWVSARIRQEREHCCDDIAAEVCGDAVFYAASLAELDDVRGREMRLMAAAAGTSLLPRVRRLLRVQPGETPVPSTWTGGALTALCVLAVLITLLARSGTGIKGATPAAAIARPMVASVGASPVLLHLAAKDKATAGVVAPTTTVVDTQTDQANHDADDQAPVTTFMESPPSAIPQESLLPPRQDGPSSAGADFGPVAGGNKPAGKGAGPGMPQPRVPNGAGPGGFGPPVGGPGVIGPGGVGPYWANPYGNNRIPWFGPQPKRKPDIKPTTPPLTPNADGDPDDPKQSGKTTNKSEPIESRREGGAGGRVAPPPRLRRFPAPPRQITESEAPDFAPRSSMDLHGISQSRPGGAISGGGDGPAAGERSRMVIQRPPVVAAPPAQRDAGRR